MPAGRPQTPSALKVLRGNPGRRPLNDAEPEFAHGPIDCPDWLPTEGKALFVELVDLLGEPGVKLLTIADKHALSLLCDAYAEFRTAGEKVKAHGLTYTSETANGEMIRPRPEVAIRADAWRRVRAMLSEFGLTPSSRAKTILPPGSKLSEWDEFASN